MKFALMVVFIFSLPFVAYAVDYSPLDCTVVGNLNSHIYHVQGGEFYARMLVKNKRGDNRVCFATENEARKAGYRASKR